jgi:hypothetical protein
MLIGGFFTQLKYYDFFLSENSIDLKSKKDFE